MTTRHQFDAALDELRESIVKLGTMAYESLSNSMKSLMDQDMELANQVIVGDLAVNDLQADIEEKCMFLIATQQPFARDLRKIVAGFKISINLERIGDLAVDIAKVTLRIGKTPLIKPLIDTPRMSELIRDMIKQGLDAYLKEDEQAARNMSQIDDQVDHLHNQVFRELLVLMMENPKTINQATHLLFTSRFLERAGDYCTNIAEEIVYIVTGRRSDLNQ